MYSNAILSDRIRNRLRRADMTVFILKWIAIVTMLIDHVGYIYITRFPDYYIFRGIGRFAFPIFVFFIAEGCIKTQDIKKYMIRLFSFALISEFAFDYAFHGTLVYIDYQNIFFTLFLGALSIYAFNQFQEKDKFFKFAFLMPILMSVAAEFLHTDYGGIGVLMIFFLYYYRQNFRHQALVLVFGNITLALSSHPIQFLGILTIVPLYFYNGQRGKNAKYLFYAFYPVHLLILGLMKGVL